jgi:hypothetical protein
MPPPPPLGAACVELPPEKPPPLRTAPLGAPPPVELLLALAWPPTVVPPLRGAAAAPESDRGEERWNQPVPLLCGATEVPPFCEVPCAGSTVGIGEAPGPEESGRIDCSPGVCVAPEGRRELFTNRPAAGSNTIPDSGAGAACPATCPTPDPAGTRVEPATAPGAGVTGCGVLRAPITITLGLTTRAGGATIRPGSMACRSGEISGRSNLWPDSGFTERMVPGPTGRPLRKTLALTAVPQDWPCGQGLLFIPFGRPVRGIHPIHPGPPYQVTSPGDQAPKLPGNHIQPMPGIKFHPPK